MLKTSLYILFVGFALLIFVSCGEEKSENTNSKNTSEVPVKRVKIPAFSGDSAYVFVEKQLAFGHRIPGTAEHKACQNWLAEKLTEYGATVEIQAFKAKIYTGDVWDAANIIASFNPDKKERIIVAAHYDTRFIAEKDSDESKRNKPIMGADDGASGVSVILEIARLIKDNPIDLGVDLILFDAEDNGNTKDNDSWCLGSQYWSGQAVKTRYRAKWGILLDMVGAKGAVFPKEYFSQRFAATYHNKVWDLAIAMGYGDHFQDQIRGAVNDDHYHVSSITGIPMIDIINLPSGDGFGDYHHTHKDDIDIIDKSVLRKVGQVVTAVLYKSSDNRF
jgi:glutaminyl-peptide cyclotransferase